MDIAKRFDQNPLLKPQDIKASSATMRIACLLNPGVFMYYGASDEVICGAEFSIKEMLHSLLIK